MRAASRAQMSSKTEPRYKFGDFRLDSEPPSLWRDEHLVALPPKALEMLLLLVRQRDVVVSREVLLETLWRDTFVEEGNINYLLVLEATRQLLDSYVREAQLEADLRRSWAELERSVGRSLVRSEELKQ